MPSKELYESSPVERGGRSYFCMDWPDEEDGGAAEPYTAEVLLAGVCRSYLPMVFSREEGRIKACYDRTGFIPVRRCLERKWAEERSFLKSAVWLLRKLTEGEEEAEDFLLSGDRVALRTDSVFVTAAGDGVARAYLPSGQEEIFSRRLLKLLRELERSFPESGLSLLGDKLEAELEGNTPGTGGLLRLFSGWERELN